MSGTEDSPGSAAVWEVPLRLPRNAFTPRDVARAGDIWRACQDAAVTASTRAGWSPMRYREAGTAFVVRSMTVRHDRETLYGEELTARTWVTRFARGTLSTRQIRFLSGPTAIAAATQLWVHVDASLRPTRGGPELVDAFPVHDEGDDVTLPEHEPAAGPEHVFELRCWHTWMDPLDHVNHPVYVDWCDEAISRVMADAGLSPRSLRPVAEQMTFKAGVTAGDAVRVTTARLGVTEAGEVVLAHRVTRGDEEICAQGRTVRALASPGAGALVDAFG